MSKKLFPILLMCVAFCAEISAQGWVVFPKDTTTLLPLVPPKNAQPQQPVKPVVPPKNAKGVTYINLEWADTWDYNQEFNPDAQILGGNVTFSHDGVFMYCDTAYFYEAKNSFTAFGNILINQGDTLFCYSDELYYDGNTKVARLRHNVLMDNLTATLSTDSLNYDRIKNVGYYFDNGVIRDTLNTLTSETGYYFPATKEALFRTDVVLENPDFTMLSDTLKYNTETKVASIVGPTNIIYAQETHIYSEYGWYNTDNEQSKLLLNSHITHNSGKKLIADTIFYDKKNGKGEGFSHVQIIDTIQKVSLHGNYGYYIEEGEVGLVTDSAMMVEYSSEDTLFLHADTLYTRAEKYKIFEIKEILEQGTKNKEQGQEVSVEQRDSINQAIAGQARNDSAFLGQALNDSSLPPDTVWRDSTCKIFIGCPNVRFWRTNIQGVCDSSYYNTRDSILHLLKSPIIWSDARQLSGDTIRLFPKDSTIDRAVVTDNAFVCEFVEEKRFNQLSGKEITGYIAQSQLNRVDVRGNAESIYFPQDDEDKSVIGMAQTVSSIMNIYFKDGEKERAIERIVLLPKPSGSMFPLKDVTDDMLYLGNFSWQISKKPISKFDIFRNTNARFVSDGESGENQDVEMQPKKKTTRRDDVKPVEETIKDKKRTTSTDNNRPSGFATPSMGGGSGSSFGGGGGLRKQM
ncbi:MAG: hypothetical protein LBN95_10095 [Prevotellaceae bacterium]|jgi:hypothetical protein|nr:hypothetical protein [Prevotellaceae bacterium]